MCRKRVIHHQTSRLISRENTPPGSSENNHLRTLDLEWKGYRSSRSTSSEVTFRDLAFENPPPISNSSEAEAKLLKAASSSS